MPLRISANQTSRIATIVALQNSIMRFYDPYQDGHMGRVSNLSVKLATHLKLDKNLIETIKYSAQLHDIGKLLIPEHILNKVGLLSDVEREMIKSHSLLGWKVLKPLGIDETVCTVIGQHHENWDGTGYPFRLKDDDIHIGARVLRVPDCFDAMTNLRVYNKIFSIEQAVGVMEKEKGISFDPEVFEKFVDLLYVERNLCYNNL